MPDAASTSTTRVALVALPPLLRDIVSTFLSGQPDIELVIASGAAERSAKADVVVVASEAHELTPSVMALLYRRPSTRVLTVVADGRDSFLYALKPQVTRLGELSLETLLTAIREDHP